MIEFVLHVLRDCPMASSVWNSFVDSKHIGTFYWLDHNAWINANLNHFFYTGGDITWSRFWSVAVWKLWSSRNAYVHNANFTRPYKPVDVIKVTLLDYDKGKNALKLDGAHIPRVDVQITWSCLNMGGSSLTLTERFAGSP